MASHIVGYPRMGPKREPKLALESFWDRKSIPVYLQKVAADLRESIWNPSVEYFIVPEWGPAVKFSYASHKGVTEYKEAKAGVTAFGFDLVRGTKTLDLIKDDFPEGEYFFAGMVDGWNIWANDLAASLSTLESLEGIVGKDKLVVSIAVQKVVDEVIFYANAAAQASRKSSPRGQRCGVPKLFGIEETKGDRDPINNTEEEIGISPPANNRSPRPMMVKISTNPFPKTMRVKITVNSREYAALIDTGSTYNVLHPRVAREVGLKIIHDDPIEVRIADGSIMRSEGSCPEFKFEIQEGQFATEAYILQLGGFDVILGIEWLMGLGQIKNWDFASLKMELKQGGKTIQIKGMDTEESEEGCSTDEKLVSMVREGVKYGAGIVYDIHSPRVPSTEEIADGINMMLAVLKTIQVNPDCGQPRRLSMIPAC